MTFAVILAAEATAPALPADAPLVWLGVTMGEPVQNLRPRFGDPLHLTRFPDAMIAAGLKPPAGEAPQRKMDYWLGDALFLIVSERHGYVVGIEAYADSAPPAPLSTLPTDPRGAVLGQTVDEVARQLSEKPPSLSGLNAIDTTDASSGLRVRYEFRGGRLNSIQWSRPPAQDAAGAELSAIAEPAGDGFTTAILDVQPDETRGVRWEYLYLAAHHCDGATRWQKTSQALATHDRSKYDILHVVCPTTKAERDFYFDITPYFGK